VSACCRSRHSSRAPTAKPTSSGGPCWSWAAVRAIPTSGQSTPQIRIWGWGGPAGDSSQADTAPSSPAPATEAPASGGSHR
jgi:hypothetical protein